MAYSIKFMIRGFYTVSIVVVNEFKYLYFEVWVGCEGRWCVGGAPKMHNISCPTWVGHSHLGR